MDFETLDISKLNEKQKQRLEGMKLKLKDIETKALKLVERADSTIRTDRNRRNIVLGALLQTRAETDDVARHVYESLLPKVDKNQRYLFKEVWPDAPRPQRRGGKAATRPAAGTASSS